jgi:hypothetical protein
MIWEVLQISEDSLRGLRVTTWDGNERLIDTPRVLRAKTWEGKKRSEDTLRGLLATTSNGQKQCRIQILRRIGYIIN